MQVDFNNCRRQLAYAYNRLCKTLDGEIDNKGNIDIHVDDIQRHMDDLRTFIVGIICTYDEGNPDFADISEGIDLAVFNDEDEQQHKEGGA